MKKNYLFEYIAFSLTLLIAVPGRLSYGLILLVLFNLLMLSSTAFKSLILLLNLKELKQVLTIIFLVFFTVVFRQCLILYSPVCALTLGFQIYLPSLSSFILGALFNENDEMNLVEQLEINMKKSLTFSLYAFCIFILRDFLGYGSISFPVPRGVFELNILHKTSFTFIGVFFASIPGALVLVSLSIILFAFFAKENLIAQNTVEVFDDK